MFPNDDVVQRFNLLRSRWCLATALLLVGVLNGCAFRHLVGPPVQAGRHAQFERAASLTENLKKERLRARAATCGQCRPR